MQALSSRVNLAFVFLFDEGREKRYYIRISYIVFSPSSFPKKVFNDIRTTGFLFSCYAPCPVRDVASRRMKMDFRRTPNAQRRTLFSY